MQLFHSASEETQSPAMHLCAEEEQGGQERCSCSQCECSEDSVGSECSVGTGSKTFAVNQCMGDLAKATCGHLHLCVPVVTHRLSWGCQTSSGWCRCPPIGLWVYLTDKTSLEWSTGGRHAHIV